MVLLHYRSNFKNTQRLPNLFKAGDSARQQSAIEYLRATAQNYLDRERVAGILLIIASVVALGVANSEWGEAYFHILEYELLIGLSSQFEFGLSLEKWINDGLMAIFFLVAGLELKREILVGELSTQKSAVLPIVAAIGGIVFPAAIFLLLNRGQPTEAGWGIPVATDIAYSLGILGLLGKRIPGELKALLVGIAIADDIAAVLIIAFFYTAHIEWASLGGAAICYGILWFINLNGVKNLRWYMLLGLVLWYFFLESGIHPTVAGVLLALVIPTKPRIDSADLARRTDRYVAMLSETDIETRDPMQDMKQRKILRRLAKDTKRSRPPLLKLENALVGFNAYFIIPLFALANAGVALDIPFSDILDSDLALGIVLGLVIGKAAGISVFSFAAKQLGIVEFNPRISSWHIIGLGLIAGIGFTMSLFITNLAFDEAGYVQLSKIAILAASVIAAVGGSAVLLTVGKPKR